MAVGDHLSSVATQSGGGMNAGEENQGCIAKTWVNCQGGLQILAVTSDTRKVGSLTHEALKEAVLRSVAKSTRWWLVSCDGNREPEGFRRGKWVKLAAAEVVQLGGTIATYWARTAGGVQLENTLDYLVTSKTLSNSVF